jgi:hypothetical protein
MPAKQSRRGFGCKYLYYAMSYPSQSITMSSGLIDFLNLGVSPFS